MADPENKPMGDGAEFDRYAASYDEDLHRALSVTGEDKNYFSEGRMAWLGGWLKQTGIGSASVLDYGCGTGSATPFILKHLGAERIVGTDVSPESLKVAEAAHGSPRSSFRPTGEGSAGEFDVAFCNGVFHHIAPDKRSLALKEIHDSLRPGGVFAMFENNPWNPATRYVMSRCEFDRDAITLAPPESRKRMKAAGFEILTTRYLFVFPAMLKALRKLEPLLSPIPLGGQYVVVGRKKSS
ncbi:MAG: methyltransferase [Luteolibacter sp.]